MKVIVRTVGLCLLALAAGSCHKQKEATVAPATRVKTIAVKPSMQTVGRTYSGTVEESSGTALSFSAAGTIRQMNVGVGDRVAKGQLIATLDGVSLKNAYDIAQATLNQAQDAYDRLKQLHDANALPDMQWVEVQNTLSQAKSAAAIAKKGLDDARLYAPKAGYISEKMADAGMNVAPGMPVVKLVDINPVKVSVSIPENEIADIRKHTSAQIMVGALGGKVFSGTLSEKGIAANILSRSYDVKFQVANPSGELLPGMICDVAMAADSARTIIAVPVDAVLLDADNSNFVWLSKKGKAEKRIVEIDGMTSGSHLIVKSGLAEGDSIIVSGQQKVSQGTPVVNVANNK